MPQNTISRLHHACLTTLFENLTFHLHAVINWLHSDDGGIPNLLLQLMFITRNILSHGSWLQSIRVSCRINLLLLEIIS